VEEYASHWKPQVEAAALAALLEGFKVWRWWAATSSIRKW